MAEEQSGQERSEEPTGKRLDEARKKGQVARSRELNTFFVVFGALMFLWLTSGQLSDALASLFIQLLSPSKELMVNPELLTPYLGVSFLTGFLTILPLLVITVFLALLGPAVMGGLVFSFDALAPKPEKLDPVKGLSRMFSTKGLVELVKALMKFLLISAVAVLLFFSMQTEIMSLARLDVIEGIGRSAQLIIWAALCAALSLVIVALLDVPYQIWEHAKQLKMTKQEVKDESKETEGRPEVKSRVRQLQLQASQRRMLEDVPKADVVITNPTHFSVALKYDQDSSAAPMVVAKGADLIALKIRSIALESDVPIFEEPPLARAIYGTTEIGDEIPAPLFLAVARVLAYVFQLARTQSPERVPRPEPTPLPMDFQKYHNEGELNGF